MCMGMSLINGEAVICHYITISHVDSECLARSIEGVDQPSAQNIERLL